MNKIKWPEWPNYGKSEADAVTRVITSNQLFAADEVRSFEKRYADYIGVSYVLGLGNATQALHLSLAALDIGVGDEVIVTPLSWISTASCILMQNAVPVFSDIEKETLGLCPKALENNITKRTKAIIVTHLYGYPAMIKEILDVANRYDIPVIEDASHAHGASINEKMIGSFGKISVFSLHQRKALSVGDGGLLCTNDKEIAEKVYRLRSFGDDELSYNYRMTEFAGALGKVALSKLNKENEIRISNAESFFHHFEMNENIKVRVCSNDINGVYYSLLFELSDNSSRKYNDVINQANAIGLPLTKIWKPLNQHNHFNPTIEPARGMPWKWNLYHGEYCKHTNYKDVILPVTYEYASNNRLFQLPIHPPVGEEHIKKASTILLDLVS